MSDLPKRLRDYAQDWRDRAASETICIEAADEIARLRARNAELKTSLLALVDAMHLYEMDSDGPAPQRHREMMRRAKALAIQRGGE